MSRKRQRRKLIRGMRKSVDLLIKQKPASEFIRRMLNILDGLVLLLELERN
jgi:hypothetical protein